MLNTMWGLPSFLPVVAKVVVVILHVFSSIEFSCCVKVEYCTVPWTDAVGMEFFSMQRTVGRGSGMAWMILTGDD